MRRCTRQACAAALALTTLVPVARASDQPRSPAIPAGRSGVQRVQTLERELLAAVNRVRAERGRRPFRGSRRLRTAAAAHSREMATRGYFRHESANGAPFWRRIERFYTDRGYRDWGVAENIATGSPGLSVGEALAEWMRSPPHRANLLSGTWRDAGIGAVFAPTAPGYFGGSPTLVVTLDLGERHR